VTLCGIGIAGASLQEATMITRVWHGWTTHANAAAYEQLLRDDVLPGIDRIVGFAGASLLRRETADGVEFVTLTRWNSLDAVRAFAGEDYERAVVPPEARALLSRFDETSLHYETVAL